MCKEFEESILEAQEADRKNFRVSDEISNPGVAGWRLKPATLRQAQGGGKGSGRPGADSFFAKKWRSPFGDGHDIQHSHLKAEAEARERLLPPPCGFFTHISLVSRLSSLVLLLNLTHYVFTAD